MKKRIIIQMVLLTAISILFLSIVLCAVFYNHFASQQRADLRLRVEPFRVMEYDCILELLEELNPQDVRVTLVSGDGKVQYDNIAASDDLSSHLGREEIDEALVSGSGESRRFSDTQKTETYYYAIRMKDGSVLRMAKNLHSIWRLFFGVLPVIAVAMLLLVLAASMISNKLAVKVVAPIGRVDLSDEPHVPYDELIPFAKTIAESRRRIAQDGEILREREETISAILDNMDEGVVVLDRLGMILTVNKSASRIFSPKESMVGRSVRELLRDLEFHEGIDSALQSQREELTIRQGERDYRTIISPVSERGVIILFMDITDKADAERIRREFSANVSHELKTPLTSIYGTAEMLDADVVKEADKPQFYRKIMDEAARLITLIEDIIMLSQLDEGGLQMPFEEVRLEEIAAQCRQSLEQKSAVHQVAVHISGTGAMQANPSVMRELFYNLMDNGIKYNRPGGYVSISICQASDRIDISVADCGIGITPEDQKRVFERFYRVDKSRSRKSGGTGLGLAIAKHAAMIHGGHISVTSQLEKGSEFQIVFPVGEGVC